MNEYVYIYVACGDQKMRVIKVRNTHLDIKKEIIIKKYNVKKEFGLYVMTFDPTIKLYDETGDRTIKKHTQPLRIIQTWELTCAVS